MEEGKKTEYVQLPRESLRTWVSLLFLSNVKSQVEDSRFQSKHN